MCRLNLDGKCRIFPLSVILSILTISSLIELLLYNSPLKELRPLFPWSEYPKEEDKVESLDDCDRTLSLDHRISILIIHALEKV